MHRGLTMVGAGAGFLGVALGAFGAHGLRDRLSPEMLAIYQTGVQYHLVHTVGILVCAIAAASLGRKAAVAGWLMALGIVIFSGSLYALATTGTRALGAITPFGGVAFLAGWTMLLIAAAGAQAPRP